VGRAQVQARAQDFLERKFQFDRIVASTLQRAHETAKIIGQALNTPVETDPDWMELDNGPLAGISREAALEQYPVPSFRNPYEPFCGTGESDWEIYCRSARAVEKSFGAAQAAIWLLHMAASSTAHCEPSSERSRS
jgi:2,3-bisphosphoglycerate-dependent phosphoglycerate mutase